MNEVVQEHRSNCEVFCGRECDCRASGSVASNIETLLTDETRDAIARLAAHFDVTANEVLAKLMTEAVRRQRGGAVREPARQKVVQ